MSSSSSSPSPAWTDEQIESIIITILVALLSFGAYYFMVRPRVAATRQQQQQQQQRQRQPTNIPQQRGFVNGARRGAATAVAATNNNRERNANTNTNVNVNSNDEDDDGVLSILAANTRKPPHFIPTVKQVPSRLYQEGVIPFRYTLASTHESRKQLQQQQKDSGNSDGNGNGNGNGIDSKTTKKPQPSPQQLINRKDRARVLTKLLIDKNKNVNNNDSSNNNTSIGITPPSRGSNIVVSIPATRTDVNCENLRRVLFLLGSYFNLFVLLDLSLVAEVKNGNNDDDVNTSLNEYQKDKNRLDDLILQLRGRSTGSKDDKDEDKVLSEEILPSHRILTTNSISSRVAFVRQLPNAEIIIDYEEECMTQLTRFGFKVILYPLLESSLLFDDDENENENENRSTYSSLGKEMLG